MMERTPVRGGIEPETVYLQAVGALCRSRLGALFEDDEEMAREDPLLGSVAVHLLMTRREGS